MDLPYYRATIMKNKSTYISSLVAQLQKKHDLMVLQSQMGNHPASKKTLLASKPKYSITIWDNLIELKSNDETKSFTSDAFDALKEFRESHKDWMFGFFGYDLKNHVEQLHSKNKELISTPDAWFFVPELLIELDELTCEMSILRGELPKDLRKTTILNNCRVKAVKQIDKDAYIKQIQEAKSRIKEGEFYEINLSHALEYEFEGDSWSLFEQMRVINPVPFAAYLQKGDLSICCASPERFLQKRGNILKSQPIKGTISRSSADDKDLNIELLRSSEKDKAENLMIVDLVRNDLGKVAIHGSVNVSNLFEIQSFGTVHQMVSTVEAVVEDEVSIMDIVRATFPMGSMTGAPKVASMQAIEELENYKRGLYSGAIGYITPDNDFDFNVVIRTAQIHNERLIFAVGGAITADSIPEKEWEETLLKAKIITTIADS